MAPAAFAHRLTTALLVCGCATSCGRAHDTFEASWQFVPAAPIVSVPVATRLTLRDKGALVRGATLQVEAHMSHPGMAPVTGRLVERADGVYESRLALPMSGEWTVVATGALADGTRITESTRIHAAAAGQAPAAPR